MKYLAGFFALFVATLGITLLTQHCMAQDVALQATYTKLTWTAPTTRMDGVPFDIVEENGYYNLTWTRGSQSGTARLAPNLTEYNIANFKANTQFWLTACDDMDTCSAQSNTVTKPGGPPLSPRLEGVP